MDILVYTEKKSERLAYVLDWVLKERLGLDYAVVCERDTYRNAALPGICYAEQPVRLEGEIHIPSAGLSGETEIRGSLPQVDMSGDIPVLFPAGGNRSFPFDLFSAVFFLLSRYEEYLPFEKDNHGRFPARAALAYRHGFLETPVVDHWVMMLAERLRTAFPALHVREKEFRFLPTFDVDQVFAVREKPFFRWLGGALKSGDLAGRRKIRRGLEQDPFDTFRVIRRMHEPRGLKPFFFFHTGRWGRYDKSLSPEREPVRQIIRDCAGWGRVGLHPSYRSAEDPERLFREKERLEKVLGQPVTASRQHFIRLSFPETYRHLLAAGITGDYSMGFPEAPGFRAGTAYPFRWFDLVRNETTGLTVYPFVVMDGALRKLSGENNRQALSLLDDLLRKMSDTGGWFIPLWHNHTLGDAEGWHGWREIYEEWMTGI